MILMFVERFSDFPHGISRVNEYMIDTFEQKGKEVVVCRLIAKQISRLHSVLSVLNFIMTLFTRSPDKIYFVLSATYVSRLTLRLIYLRSLFYFEKPNLILHVHRSDISDYGLTGLHFLRRSGIQLTMLFLNRDQKFEDFIKKKYELNLNVKCYVIRNALFDDVKREYETPIKGISKIIFLSNVCVEKGIIDFLDMCSAIQKRLNFLLNFEVHGKIINSYSVSQLQLEVQKRNVNVKYHGPYSTDDLDKILSTDTIILFTSKNEADPLVLHEALYYNTVFFTTNVGYIEDLVGVDFPHFIELDKPQLFEKSVTKVVDFIMNPPNECVYSAQELIQRRHKRNDKILDRVVSGI